MLEINNLTKVYGTRPAIDHLTMHIDQGSIFGFVGPNGAGKTTTMKIIAGLLLADAGTVTIDGIDALTYSQAVKGMIGYMPDLFGGYDNLTVMEYMLFYAALYQITGKEARIRCEMLLEQSGLREYSDELVETLSHGIRQKLCFIRTVIHKPKLLILDEPASGLEPRTRKELQALLLEQNKEGVTILISSHILTELSECCTHIGILEAGRLVIEGDVKKIMARQKLKNPMTMVVLDGMQRALTILKNNPKVSNVMQDKEMLTFLFIGEKEEEANLLLELVANEVRIQAFSRQESNLEDLFLKLTK